MTLSAEEFVVHEAELIDDRRWDDWLALFAPDGRYWIPLQGAAQVDADSHNALALEDRLLLELRVKRLHSPRAHSQHPASPFDIVHIRVGVLDLVALQMPQ